MTDKSRQKILTEVEVVKCVKAAPVGVRRTLQALQRAGAKAVIVGGAVRDAFLAREISDWDLATDASPSDVANLFERVVRTGEQHGTIMVLTQSGPVEVTSFRSEGPYEDGRRPTSVTFHCDLNEDLARRDFTINAMAFDWGKEKVVDPFDGQADLQAGCIRCVGEPLLRFGEDGLRPLRALRFAAQLGFAIDRATQDAIAPTLQSFEKVAWERKRVELEKLLAGPTLTAPLQAMGSSGMLKCLAHELEPLSQEQLAAILRVPRAYPWLRLAAWAALQNQTAACEGILSRWKVSKRIIERTKQALRASQTAHKQLLSDMAKLRRWLSETPAASRQEAVLLSMALDTELQGLEQTVETLMQTQPVLSLSQLAITGAHLVSIGLKGEQIGTVLEQLLSRVHEDPEQNTEPALLRIAQELSTTV